MIVNEGIRCCTYNPGDNWLFKLQVSYNHLLCIHNLHIDRVAVCRCLEYLICPVGTSNAMIALHVAADNDLEKDAGEIGRVVILTAAELKAKQESPQ